MHHHDETRRDRPTVGSPAAVDAYKDKTRQLLKAGCVEISGSGRQVAQQRGREGESVVRAAVIGGGGPPRCDRTHLTDSSQLDAVSGCQVWKRSSVGPLHC